MNQAAFTAAEASFRRAEQAVQLLEALGPDPHVQHMKVAIDAWSDLLTYGNRVFTKLEQGAKQGPSLGWFQNQKTDRKTDPLMTYMLQARNADEHGIGLVAVEEEGTTHIEAPSNLPAGTPLGQFSIDSRGDIAFTPVPGVTKVIGVTPRRIELRPVTNRGVTYQPPN